MMTDSTLPNQPSVQDYADKLLASRNIILHGAPGTGKTYLAKQIAAHLITGGTTDNYADLTPEQQEQCGFVQFHPSYDYSDFVEGLRPVRSETGEIGFELRDGIFKEFCINVNNNQIIISSSEDPKKILESFEKYYNNLSPEKKILSTKTGTNEFIIKNFIGEYIETDARVESTDKAVKFRKIDLEHLLENPIIYNLVDDIHKKLPGNKKWISSYVYPVNNTIVRLLNSGKLNDKKYKKYIFIIDEINRGEISKIFGELFYSLDPGYRGPTGAISTQYSNLHTDPEEKFYIPENVYIIGTMNDIDRSVDTFDFAMRRRFRFINVGANQHIGMLGTLNPEIKDEAIQRMHSLNDAIDTIEGLNHNYHVGAAYFLKLKDINNDFDVLWSDYLEPLLQDYVSGLYNSAEAMTSFKQAYGVNI